MADTMAPSMSPVWARNPLMSSGRCWMRLSRFLIMMVGWSAAQEGNPSARGARGHLARQSGHSHSQTLKSGPRTRPATLPTPAFNADERSGIARDADTLVELRLVCLLIRELMQHQ